MYRTNKNKQSFHSRSSTQKRGSQPQQFNHSRGTRARKIKKLDERLFIKKAIATEPTQVQSASTHGFGDFGLTEKLLRNIATCGYDIPTPIQEKTIPLLLEGKDVIGIANTGTGKTAAFLIPLINKASLDHNQRVIIVTPTRELAMQISDELKKLIIGMGFDSVLCIGGVDLQKQGKKLRNKPHFVIGTPGRLKDLIERNKLPLFQFNNFVLDEVDKMVDIGFINDIKYFISLLPQKRHSLFFSATLTDKVTGILNSFVTNPVRVSVKSQETAEHIDQDIVRVNGNKVDILHELLIKEEFEKVLIFGRTKWGIDKLMRMLNERGFKTAAIHGNKTQGQRQRALEAFKEDHVQILLATDVASRGIHIDNVTHVINYDAPETYDDYVHRIGRTGRAGKRGVALTFVE